MTTGPTFVLVVALLPAAAGAAQGGSPPGASSAPSSAAPARETPSVSFEEASRRAAAARDTGDPAEAVRWYREGVRLRPDWDEGWWYIGALSYERHDSSQAARAFGRFVALKPDSGPGWALRGLVEFDRRHYDLSMRYLAHGLSLGSVGNAEIRDVVYYDMAVLRLRAGQFPLASEPLAALARAKTETPALVTACGLFVLGMAMLPEDVPAEKQELVQAAGRAGFSALGLKREARPRFEELLARYPDTPNLHYGYGSYLLQLGADYAAPALDAFRKEIEVDPKAVYPRLEIAFELMKQGEHAAALPYAEEATRLAPGLFAAHHALGRALLETGQVPRGVSELERAVRLAPESPDMRAALARAYVMAGRREDAEKERDAYRRLQVAREKDRLPGFAREDTIPEEAKKP
ncbi:MAG TPA: tetratricopeptide repeat protein [Vicinamibacteria bacterium]|nr:tetratricopeptide repeat protein [Vicinamibacteria bacterium]